MLRHNWLSLVLLALVGASCLLACWTSIMWFRGARQAQELDFRLQRMNNVSSSLQALAAEAVEFSRKHPSMEPLLREHSIRVRPGIPAAAHSQNPMPPAGAASP